VLSSFIDIIRENTHEKLLNMGRNSNKNARKSGYIFEYRFTLFGGAKVGKTSVLNRFISDTFTHRYRPTIEDHITHTIDHNGNICVCLFIDTCGANDFPAMRRLAISKGNAFLLVYAIDDCKSFIEAKRRAEEIIKLKDSSEDVKIMLIGNKSDLEDQREVDRQDGENLVEKLNNGNVSSMFFEVSSFSNTGISDIFARLLSMFIPEETEMTLTTEKSAFSRMSFRRRSKKKQLRKKRDLEVMNTNDSNYYSDTEIEPCSNYLQPQPKTQLVRSSSATSHISESDSGLDSSPNTSPLFGRREAMIRRESSAKEILRKTFGSMQRIFVKPHEANNNNNNTNQYLKRSGTIESIRSLGHSKKQSTL